MNIGMKKITEDSNFVYYQFYTDVDIGFDKTIWEMKYGFCKFNKQTEEFELVIDKTDPYFLNKDNREIVKVHAKLIKIKRAHQEFPNQTGVATG